MIKENCTPDLRIAMRTYHVDDLEAKEEVVKEQETFAQENQSTNQTKCKRCNNTDGQRTQPNGQWKTQHCLQLRKTFPDLVVAPLLGRVGVRSIECSQKAENGQRCLPQRGECSSKGVTSPI